MMLIRKLGRHSESCWPFADCSGFLIGCSFLSLLTCFFQKMVSTRAMVVFSSSDGGGSGMQQWQLAAEGLRTLDPLPRWADLVSVGPNLRAPVVASPGRVSAAVARQSLGLAEVVAEAWWSALHHCGAPLSSLTILWWVLMARRQLDSSTMGGISSCNKLGYYGWKPRWRSFSPLRVPLELVHLFHEKWLGENPFHLWASVGSVSGVTSSLEASFLDIGLGSQCLWVTNGGGRRWGSWVYTDQSFFYGRRWLVTQQLAYWTQRHSIRKTPGLIFFICDPILHRLMLSISLVILS
jgi:hypothetical protein